MNTPNYRAFARDMMKLCEKHGVEISAYSEGNVILGPSDGKIMRDYPFDEFKFSPTSCQLAGWKAKPLEMTREKGEVVDGEQLEVAKGSSRTPRTWSGASTWTAATTSRLAATAVS